MLVVSLLLGASLVAGLPAQNGFTGNATRPAITMINITQAMHGIEGRSLFGPQLGINFPDPSLIWGDGSWKAYSTSSDGKGVPVANSPDGLTWSLLPNDALPDPGSWVDPVLRVIWAPDVNRNDNGVFFMYYAAQRPGGPHCIGLATSPTALGPFTASQKPLICDDAHGGVIDPAGYDDGVDRWILWKVDGNNLGGATTCQPGRPTGTFYNPTPIMIQKVSRDGFTLLDEPKVILDNEGAKNDGVVEAPTLWKSPTGGYVLFYSAHCYAGDDYDIEYAWSPTIDGKYGERSILFRSTDGLGVFAPGHPDIDPNGVNMVFHGRLGPDQGTAGVRQLFSATLNIDGRAVTF